MFEAGSCAIDTHRRAARRVRFAWDTRTACRVVRVPSFLGYNRRMRILLSNDDGYLAPGLAALYEALKPIADVTVMAPEQNCSGASNSLTLSRPLSVANWKSPYR